MEFEWDDVKAAKNVAKHGISFKQAVFIFDGCYVTISCRVVNGEIRQKVIGDVEGFGVTIVIATSRDGRIRIISARRANKKERDFYYEHNKTIA
ncbi:MAG: BrnT family toxin [Leptolyngbya sp. SIO3F4]|nr:BrnT family toxin [Leptolyngbya sp. SIO3F4]